MPAHSVRVTTEGPYSTMPYARGESLRAQLARGPVRLADAVAILRDGATALEYAHADGSGHREIEPENVLVSGRTAVVTDVGIAVSGDLERATFTTREYHGDAWLTKVIRR